MYLLFSDSKEIQSHSMLLVKFWRLYMHINGIILISCKNVLMLYTCAVIKFHFLDPVYTLEDTLSYDLSHN